MIELQKENLRINKLIADKKEIIFAEGDMIVPDSKPDILNTISTSGVVSIYKEEVQDGKIRIDGSINTYIMYMPDGTEDAVRGLNTTIDFSENISVSNVQDGMNAVVKAKIKTIEARVINGRKVGIKASLEVSIKVYQDENVEFVNDIQNDCGVQMLKDSLNVNSLIGSGNTKIYAKENIQIDSSDNLAEILRASVQIVGRDVKLSYNKVLTKAELEIQIMYLTEASTINKVTYKIPAVGFVDINDVNENSLCDVNYEVRNIVIKPNSQEEHSIYVEIELDVMASAYEEKQINLIQDMYSPTQNLEFNKKIAQTITNKGRVVGTKEIRERVNLKDIDGENLIDVDIRNSLINENKINSKIMYEEELSLKFIFQNSKSQIDIREVKIPFEYVIDNLENGEQLNTNCRFEVQNKDFVIQDGGNIDCNIDLSVNTDMYRNANINIIDDVKEAGNRENQDYSLIIYIVKKGDTLWEIAKRFGSTVDAIANNNELENANSLILGQKLYIIKS